VGGVLKTSNIRHRDTQKRHVVRDRSGRHHRTLVVRLPHHLTADMMVWLVLSALASETSTEARERAYKRAVNSRSSILNTCREVLFRSGHDACRIRLESIWLSVDMGSESDGRASDPRTLVEWEQRVKNRIAGIAAFFEQVIR